MKGILIKVPSKRSLPSDISGGEGEVAMSAEAHLGALFFECLFLNAFQKAIFKPLDTIL